MPGDPTATTPPPGHVKIGRLGRPFQLAGGLRLQCCGSWDADALEGVERVFVTGVGEVVVRQLRRHAGALVLYLQGVRDRDSARALTGADVFVAPREAVAEAAAAAAAVLAGAEVALRGTVVGRVRELRLAAVNPLLVVELAGGEALLPLDAPYVVLRGGRVELLDPPEGLLEIS